MYILLINILKFIYALPTVEDVSNFTAEIGITTDQSLIEEKKFTDRETEESFPDLKKITVDESKKSPLNATVIAFSNDTENSFFTNDTENSLIKNDTENSLIKNDNDNSIIKSSSEITRQVTFTNLKSLHEDNTEPEEAKEQYCDCRRYYNPPYCRCNVWRPNNGRRYYPTKTTYGRNPFVTQFDERNDVEWVLHLRTNFPNRLGKHFKREIRETTTPMPSTSSNIIYEETIGDHINGTESGILPKTEITMPYVAMISLSGIFFLGLIVCFIKRCLKKNRPADFTSDRRNN